MVRFFHQHKCSQITLHPVYPLYFFVTLPSANMSSPSLKTVCDIYCFICLIICQGEGELADTAVSTRSDLERLRVAQNLQLRFETPDNELNRPDRHDFILENSEVVENDPDIPPLDEAQISGLLCILAADPETSQYKVMMDDPTESLNCTGNVPKTISSKNLAKFMKMAKSKDVLNPESFVGPKLTVMEAYIKDLANDIDHCVQMVIRESGLSGRQLLKFRQIIQSFESCARPIISIFLNLIAMTRKR